MNNIAIWKIKPGMKMMKHKTTMFVAFGMIGIVGLVLITSIGRPKSEKPNTVHFLGLTNGSVGLMATTYQTFSTNTAATIHRWLHDGTNAAVLCVSNNQNSAIWLFPFTRIQTKLQSSGGYESLLLDAPNFSGIRLPAGQVVNLQVAVFAHNEPWRVELGYTKERDDSFVERLRNLPRDLRALGAKQPIVQHTTPIHTEWIQP